MSSNYVDLPLEGGGGGGGGGVTSVNTLTGALTLVGGPSITITNIGNIITISSTALPTALLSLNGSTFANQTLVTGTAGTDFAIVDNNPAGIHTFNLPTASASARGALSSADWSTFNAKQPALTFGSISTSTTGVAVGSGSNSTVGPNVTVNIQTATALQPGLLSAADFASFAAKQPAGAYITALTGDVSATGPGSVAATVNSVGGKTAAAVAQSVTDTQAATPLATASTLMKRDSSAKFTAAGIYNSTSAYTLFDLVNKQILDSNAKIMLDFATPTPTGSVLIQSTVIGQMTKSSPSDTAQFAIQNNSTGGASSTDFVVNQDTASDFNNYANFGLNASTYSDPAWTINGAGDAYLYNNDGGLAIGANISGATSNPITFFTGGSLIANLIAQFTSSGIFQLGSQTGSSPVRMQFVNANTATLAWNPSATQTLTLPPAQGANGTVLVNDGSGNLSWTFITTNIDGGSPSTNYTAPQTIIGGTP